jgi:hypothetical protein
VVLTLQISKEYDKYHSSMLICCSKLNIDPHQGKGEIVPEKEKLDKKIIVKKFEQVNPTVLNKLTFEVVDTQRLCKHVVEDLGSFYRSSQKGFCSNCQSN